MSEGKRRRMQTGKLFAIGFAVRLSILLIPIRSQENLVHPARLGLNLRFMHFSDADVDGHLKKN